MKIYRQKIWSLSRCGLIRYIRLQLLRYWAKHREIIVFQHMKGYDVLLDGGCGNGVHSAIFSSKAHWIIGLDIAGHDLVEYHRRVGDKASCIKASLEFLPFRSECFDGCILQDVLEHIKQPLGVLKQIKKCLKPEGELIITVPNWYNRFFDLNPYTIELHCSFYSSMGWKKLLEKAWFKVCIVRAIAFPIINLDFLAKHLHFFGAGVFIKAKKPIKRGSLGHLTNFESHL